MTYVRGCIIYSRALFVSKVLRKITSRLSTFLHVDQQQVLSCQSPRKATLCLPVPRDLTRNGAYHFLSHQPTFSSPVFYLFIYAGW